MSVLELGSQDFTTRVSFASLFLPRKAGHFIPDMVALGGATTGPEESETSSVLATLQLSGQAPPHNPSFLFLYQGWNPVSCAC